MVELQEVTPGLPQQLFSSEYQIQDDVPWQTHLITKREHADDLIWRVKESGVCAIDTETTGLQWALGDHAFMCIFAPDLDTSYACWNAVLNTYIMEKLVAAQTELVFHNFKFDAEMLFSAGIWMPSDYDDLKVCDTLLGFRLLFSGQDAGLKRASGRYVKDLELDGPEKAVMAWFRQNHQDRLAEKKRLKGKWVVKLEKRYDRVPFEIMFPYATQDAALTLRSYYGLKDEAAGRPVLKTLWEREGELLKIVVSAERFGWHVDRAKLEERIAGAQVELDTLMHEFSDIAPDVDVFSSKQLVKYVYDTLGEPVKHKTKIGNPSVDESALSDLDDNPEVGHLLVRIRQWKKLLDKCHELREYMMPDDAVHSDLKLTGARTGRFSSAAPALQNILNFKPAEPWTWVRDLFEPVVNSEWILFDYSQIEMRLAAHYSKDPVMMEAYHSGIDLHTTTASRVFGVPFEEVTSLQRSFGKVLNFSMLYGAGKRRITDSLRFGAAQCDPVPIEEARTALLKFVPYAHAGMIADPYPFLAAELLKSYWSAFPGMKEFTTAVSSVARQRGYIITAFGRETKVPVEHAHKATNYLIQGSAADLMKEAMIRTWGLCREYCAENNLVPWKDVALFMTVHDELIYACPDGHAAALAKKILPGATQLGNFRVPIEVDFAQVPRGHNWATKLKLKVAA